MGYKFLKFIYSTNVHVVPSEVAASPENSVEIRKGANYNHQ
jgi:hypothetical protein